MCSTLDYKLSLYETCFYCRLAFGGSFRGWNVLVFAAALCCEAVGADLQRLSLEHARSHLGLAEILAVLTS